MSGYKIIIIILINGAIFNANLSEFDKAIVFGMSSPKISIIKVIIIVAYTIPSSFVISIKILVAIADANTLTRLFAKSMVPIRISLSLNILVNNLAFLSPDFANSCILGFDAEVRDVSEPEKKPEMIIKPTIVPIKIDSEYSII